MMRKLLLLLGLIGCATLSTPLNVRAQGQPNIVWTGDVNSDRINAIIFNTAGDTVISGSSDRLINFWRASDGKLLRTLNNAAPYVHESAIESLSMTRDGTRLASATFRIVKLWTLPDGTVKNLTGHTDWVVGVAFSPNGQLLASASFDNTVKIWRASDGALLRTIRCPVMMRCVSFSPDSSLLAAGGGSGGLYLWRTSDWGQVRSFEGHTSDIYALTFSPDGTKLASGGYDSTARVWSAGAGTLLHTFQGNGNVYGVAFTPNSQQVAFTDGEGNTIRIHRVTDGSRVRLFNVETPEVQCLAISRTGMMVYGRVDKKVIMARLDGATTPTDPDPEPPPAETTWQLNLQTDGNGTITVSPEPNGGDGRYLAGTSVRVTATPGDGSRFVEWQGDSTSRNATVTLTMNSDKTLVAYFAEARQPSVVLLNQRRQLIGWFLNGADLEGQELIRNGIRLSAQLRFVGMGDINGDGSRDLVFSDQQNRLLVWYMNGTEFIKGGWIKNGSKIAVQWRAIGVEDLSGDGKADIILQHKDGRLATWLLDGPRFIASRTINQGVRVDRNLTLTAATDINGDGQSDLIWQNSQTGSAVIWTMDGTTVLEAKPVESGIILRKGWRIAAVHDFNSDGKKDIVWQNTSDGRLFIWLMDGDQYVGSFILNIETEGMLKLLGAE